MTHVGIVRVATVAQEFRNIPGFSYRHHFNLWEHCLAVLINEDVTVMHNWKGGAGAVRNNVAGSGMHFISGHLHAAQVVPVSFGYGASNRTLFGMDTGMVADGDCPAFQYLQERPRNWRSAFGILTFRDGKLLLPELVLVWDREHIQFRGELVKV